MHDFERARQVCCELLPKVSRSFALAIEALPEPLCGYVCTAYLLCRIVDTIEDHPTLVDKYKYFDCFDRCLLTIEAWENLDFSLLETMNPPQSWDAELVGASRLVFEFFFSFPKPVRIILKRHVSEMSRGMRDYTARGGQAAIVLNDTADLDLYCFYVAGTVGDLLTELFALEAGITDERWLLRQKQRGRQFALGLQKVNMIKDVVQDLKRGSVFLPRQWLNRFDVSRADLLQGESNPRVRALLCYFIRQATEHLAQARDYILDLPARPEGLRLFCIWPYTMALDTLEVGARKTGLFTVDHEIKVSRVQMFKMMKVTKALAARTTVLKLYFNRKLSSVREAAAG